MTEALQGGVSRSHLSWQQLHFVSSVPPPRPAAAGLSQAALIVLPQMQR